jgi:protein SCO1/2
MTTKRLAKAAIVVLVVAVAAWVFVIPRLKPHAFHGLVMQSATPAPAIELEATTGGLVSLDSFEGKLVVIYFGYTHCPDICPATLASLDKALELMGKGAEDVQVVMVTVDPARDTVEFLSDYMTYFDESFIGLTGSIEDVSRVATVYGVYFAADEGDAETGYTVAHNASLMVIGRDGHLRLILPPELAAGDIADDLEFLR